MAYKSPAAPAAIAKLLPCAVGATPVLEDGLAAPAPDPVDCEPTEVTTLVEPEPVIVRRDVTAAPDETADGELLMLAGVEAALGL